MPKKSRRVTARSRKWSSANIMNLVAGGILAVSMVCGSIFVFGGAPSNSSSAQTQPTIVATATTVPALVAGTPTVVITPTVVATTTPTK